MKKSEKRDENLHLFREQNKQWNMKVTMIPIVIVALGTANNELGHGLEDLEIRGRVETIQSYSIAEIGQNTEKSPGDLRRLAVTKTLVKNHHLTLV